MSLLDASVKIRDILKELSLEERKKVLDDVYLDLKIPFPTGIKSSDNNASLIEKKSLHDLFEEKKAKNFEKKILIAMVALSEVNGNIPVSKSEVSKYFEDQVEVFPSTFDREIGKLIKKKLVLSKGENRYTKYQVTTAGKKTFINMGKEEE